MIDTTRVICRVTELSDPGSRAFTMGSGDWPLRGFVVRKGDAVYGYLNRCPHAGHPLNFSPDDFFSPERTLLMCRSHGARFEMTTGLCVAGPCAGAHLRSIALVVEHGYVMLANDPDVLAGQYA